MGNGWVFLVLYYKTYTIEHDSLIFKLDKPVLPRIPFFLGKSGKHYTLVIKVFLRAFEFLKLEIENAGKKQLAQLFMKNYNI